MTKPTIEEYDTTADEPAEYVFRVNDVSGFPDTIVADLEREDAPESEKLEVSHWWHDEKQESVVVVKAMNKDTLRWLYDWLEETKQFYQTEFTDAEGEYRAAEELANAMYEVLPE